LRQDLRLALRMLRKQPGFTLIAVLTLALGIGATSAVFSLIRGVLLTPPPYRQPDRLVLIPTARSDGQPMAHPRGWPAAQWLEWQKEATSFESIAAHDWTFNFLVLNDGSVSMEGMFVTRDYFRVLGLQPVLGRTFLESETGARPADVILLGYNLWQRKFNGDPHIVGQKIRMSRQDTPLTIIGVMPPGVRFLPSPRSAQEPNYNVNAPVDFWIPAPSHPTDLKASFWSVVGRLRDGVTLPQAQGELRVLAARESQAERQFEGFNPELQSLRTEMNRDGSRILLPLLGAAALVLLIACGNAAALLLVRGLQRQQEYAVRSALGVGRIALFRQVSTEGLLLALAGGALGLVLALGAVKLFKLIGGHAIPRLDAVSTGWPVLAFGLGAAVVAALLAGILPALRASRLDPMQVLKTAGPKSSAGAGERRLLRGVTLVQTALTLALLVGAGLLIRTMVKISNVPSGYSMGRILTMTVTAVEGNYSDFHHRALERVSALPGVEHAAFAWGVPLTGNNWPATVDIEGQPAASKESDRIAIPLRAITEDYFNLLGLPILDGRAFRSSDDRKAPSVAIVNQALADRYFRHAQAVGKKLWLDGPTQPPTEIVGVVANGRTDDLTRAGEPEIYLSLWQASAFSKHLVIRTAADPRALMATVQRELRAVNPTVAVENLKTLDQIRGDSLAPRTFAMQLLAGFAVVGSVLTLVGVYGVLSLSVASRRREFAIRSAVGAQQRDIRSLIFGEGFRLISSGVVAGMAAALALSRVLRSFLFEVEPTDPVTLIGVALLFTAVALLACWAPTRRAAKVDPVEALRYE
jgi:putative ABC transport system permease protein